LTRALIRGEAKASSSFFEKKNQKNFLRLASVWGEARLFEVLRGVWGEGEAMGGAALACSAGAFANELALQG
jgi:hypothetical protein